MKKHRLKYAVSPLGKYPGFLWLVFELHNNLYMQIIDGDGKISGFENVELDNWCTCSRHDKQEIFVSVGDNAWHGLKSPHNSIVILPAKEMKEYINSNLYEYSSNPHLLIELGEFCCSKNIISLANSMLASERRELHDASDRMSEDIEKIDDIKETSDLIITDKTLEEPILKALQSIVGPDRVGDIVSQGLVSGIVINKGKVYFSISVEPGRAKEHESLRRAAEDVVRRIDGVKSVAVTLIADREPSSASQWDHGQQSAAGQIALPNIKSIIAVASGKGGVGKSTTAVNLALAFQANGLKTGILDADIYGPSLPRLVGLSGQHPQPAEDGESIRPMKAFGMEVMSIGFLVDEDAPMIWRGPMVMSAITQMLQYVTWGKLDVLVVDMPPGTGDAQLTLSQAVPLAGAVIVSTPQDLALIDARKGLNMFKQVKVPVLGIVENMSYFICPNCGIQSDIFGHGGARAEAEKIGVLFLGEIPLHMGIREKSDAGQPVVISDPEGPYAEIYRYIAEKVWEKAEINRAKQAGFKPKIVVGN